MRKQMRGFIIGVALTLAATTSVTAFAQSKNIEAFFNNIKVQINGKQVTNMDTEPFIYQGRTFVPLRFVAENMGMTVKYNENTGTVEVNGGSNASTGTADSTELVNRIKLYSNIVYTYGYLYDLSEEIDKTYDFVLGAMKGEVKLDTIKEYINKCNNNLISAESGIQSYNAIKDYDISTDIEKMNQILTKNKTALGFYIQAYNDLVSYSASHLKSSYDDCGQCILSAMQINTETSKDSKDRYYYWLNEIKNAK